MAKEQFRYRAGSTFTVEADLDYVPCPGGWRVTRGTLPGNGFTYGRGITVPEEIDGIPVVELDCSWDGPLEFIDGPSLKQATVRVSYDMSLRDTIYFGWIHGPLESLTLSVSGYVQIQCQSPTLRSLRVTAREIYIGEAGFRGCPELELVRFNGMVLAEQNWDSSSYPSEMFRNLRKLTAVYGNFHGDYLGDYAFDGCVSLAYAPNLYVRYVGDCAFRGCESLKRIYLQGTPIRIGSHAFANCTKLDSVYLPNTIAHLGSHVFECCRSLTAIHLPDKITEIPPHCFTNCTSLKKVFLSDKITSIGSGAFVGCQEMADPWIPQNLKQIGTRAFYGFRFTKPVTIPPSVTLLEQQALGVDPELVIRGVPGTEAERYATENRLRFLPWNPGTNL